MTAPQHVPDSPRTEAEPLAFTRAEFLRGAGRAWLWTTLLLIAVWGVLSGGFTLTVGSVFILMASVPGLVVGAPGAYAIGRLLRRSPHVASHAIVFATYGAAIGATTTLVAVPLMTGGSDLGSAGAAFSLVNAPVSAVGVAVAWFATARQALRSDRTGGDLATDRDADAAAEDALADRYRVIDPDPRRRRQRPRA
ncbi:hypothetical protein [Microbacterium imperiale]|uniref:Uncharacterized protein n=1 Tax=Microbacterium imperiale TaxID=33884 RepID=A0A9W6HFK6_9MICO|nr:hypothetical protein [Microbacterium imperiale]MBP2419777.1 hypothetical protein [Microbacterium imperiale]MDS0198359.1 hypothetical protein [Microbacterium imperiale]BFE40117.1 hypothetical protein GCM10017544_10730 [Microbacterium imperiale]GLJ78908.1 hypothetical protein GCM10017586_05900 [Microbacterium imperiale]